MLSAPGCWELYAWLTSGRYPRTQLTVDAYAVQHPGVPGPQASQSVCVHLLNLCRALERAGAVEDGPRFLRSLTHREYPWLTPPPSTYRVTVLDLVAASDPKAFPPVEARFAQITWDAWSMHHDQVRRWLDDPRSLLPMRRTT